MKKNSSAAVVGLAKRQRRNHKDPVELSTGYFAIITPVSATLLDSAQRTVSDPPVPMFMNEAKGREEENPSDPAYLKALEEVAVSRTLAAIDAMLVFGVDVVSETGDPIELSPDDAWVQKLRFLAKRGIVDLEGLSFDDPMDIAFMFKRYVAVSAGDIPLVTGASGLSEEEIVAAQNSFQSNS